MSRSPKVRVYEDTGPSGDWDRIMLWALSISAPHCYMEQGTEMEMSKRFSILWTLRKINHENALPICNPETLIPKRSPARNPLVGISGKGTQITSQLVGCLKQSTGTARHGMNTAINHRDARATEAFHSPKRSKPKKAATWMKDDYC